MAICKILTLDNASLIYPASLSKKYASLYRMSITLSEELDTAILQKALVSVVRRIPTFGYTLSNGSFWWYLKSLDKTPRVMPLQNLHDYSVKRNDGFLFRVSADSCTIVLDIFHVLTDGNGAMTFLLTLAAEYLRLKYNISIPAQGRILDVNEACSDEETADAFDSFSGKKGSLEQNDPAYHLRGRCVSYNVLSNLRIRMSMSQVCSVAKSRGCTVTDLLTASMVYALQDVWRRDRFRRSCSSVLKVNVPVDLRRIFPSRTLRNFSSYVHLGVDVRNGFYDFDQILTIVSAQKKLYSMPSQLEPKVAKNVQLEDNIAISCIPRVLKKPIIDIINKLKGDRYCSHTLSNIGRVELPESMRAYVKEVDFMLGRQRGNSGASACVGVGDTLILNMSRRIVERQFEDYFIEQLGRLGIDADVQDMREV